MASRDMHSFTRPQLCTASGSKGFWSLGAQQGPHPPQVVPQEAPAGLSNVLTTSWHSPSQPSATHRDAQDPGAKEAGRLDTKGQGTGRTLG